MNEPHPAGHDDAYAPQEPFKVGLSGSCPRCGQGRMFAGALALAPRCQSCGLDYSFADSGDGPAVFVTLIAGFVILGAALAFEFRFSPPIWLHIVLWLPLGAILCIGLLRLAKGVMVALQYVNKAQEARFERDEP